MEFENTATDGIGPLKKGKNIWKYIVIAIVAIAVIIPAAIYIQKYLEASDPNYYTKHQRTGNAYLQGGLHDLAIQEYQKAVKVKPDSVDANYGIGLAYLRKGNMEEATRHFEIAVKAAPSRIDLHYSLATAYQQMGRLERALEEYRKVAQKNPNSYQVFNGVGSIHMKTGDYEKAIGALKHAIELKPDYYPAYLNLGRVYEKQGKIDLAIKQYDYVRKNASKKPETEVLAKYADKFMTALNQKKVGRK